MPKLKGTDAENLKMRNELIVSLLEKKEMNARDIAAAFGISRPYVYILKARKEKGRAGKVTKRSKPVSEQVASSSPSSSLNQFQAVHANIRVPFIQTWMDDVSPKPVVQPSKEKYITTDIPLVVTLGMMGFELASVTEGDAKSFYRRKFHFDDTPELREAVTRYWNNELRVDPLAWYAEVKTMNTRVRDASRYGS